MRLRLFGKVVRVPLPAVVLTVVLLAGAVIAVGWLTGRAKELPEPEKSIQATGGLPTAASDAAVVRDNSADAVAADGSLEAVDREESATPDTRLAVHITGAVVNEGVYRLEYGSIVQDVVELCGGLKEDADTYAVNLAMRLNDGMRIHIPYKYSDDKKWLLDVGYAGTSDASGAGGQSSMLVNINTATVSELVTLSGIGESTAREIIAFREEHGSFNTIEDIMNVPGIKEAKFNRIKKYITV